MRFLVCLVLGCAFGLTNCVKETGENCVQCLDNFFLVDGFCFPYCPTGYTQGRNSCEHHSNLLFTISFEKLQPQVYPTSLLSPQNPSDDSTPLHSGIQGRGIFFDKNSKLPLMQPINPGPYLSIHLWIRLENFGSILSAGKYLKLMFSEGFIRIEKSYSQVKVDKNSWEKIEVFSYLTSSGVVNELKVKGESSKYYGMIHTNSEKFDHWWEIGGGFQGFLYFVQAFNRIVAGQDFFKLAECDSEHFSTETGCQHCSNTQENCEWNRKYLRNIEKHERMLQTCSTNCDTCDSSGALGDCSVCLTSYNLVQQVCISICPTGFDSSCAQTQTLIFDIDLTNTIKNSVVDSISSISVFSGDSSNFYPNYDAYDPYAANERGYYFKGTSYMTFTTSNLIIAPLFSIVTWIAPTSNTGTIFNKDSVIKFALNSGVLNLVIGTDSYSGTTSISNGQWHFLCAIGVLKNDFNYEVDFYIDGTLETSSDTYLGWIDDSAGTTFYIGSQDTSTDGFSGFIVEIQVYNEAIASYSTLYSSTTFPAYCDIDNYYDGSACTACDAGCTKGCVRADIKCNLCYDQQCSTCTDFTSSCTSCITNAGSSSCDCSSTFFWNAVTETCDSCQSNCDTCTASSIGSCSACSTGYYLIQNVCNQACPTGYTGSCTYSYEYVFELNLDNIIADSLIDPKSSISIGTGANTNFYPTYDSTDPYATKERGYYFTGASYMHLSSNSLILAPENTVYLWINPESLTGSIISKQTTSNSKLWTLELNSGLPESTFGSFSFSGTNSLTANTWHFIGVQLSLKTNNYYEIKFRVDSTSTETITSTSTGHFDDTSTSFTILIGENYPLGTIPFTGFIWKLSIYNSKSPDLSSLSSSLTMPASCNIDHYYDGSACTVCDTGCTKGCVRADIKCNLCYDQQCSTCTDFTSSCTSCITNAGSSPCDCSSTFFWNAVTETCDSCQSNCDTCTASSIGSCSVCSTGYYLIQNVCNQACPTGYTGSCTYSYEYVFELNLDNIIADSLIDPKSTISIGTGANTNFYPTYDSTDPYATKERGYYFTGTSYMHLSSNSLILSPENTIYLWFYTETSSCTLFSKQSSTPSILYSLDLETSFIKSTFKSFTFTSTTSVSSNTWHFLGVQYSLQTPYTYQIKFQIDSSSETQTSSTSGHSDDSSTSFTTLIGVQYPLLTNPFTGFLWKLSIYNSDSPTLSTLSSSNTSPPSCTISDFYSTSCQPCNALCTQGCVRADISCNLCYDQQCKSCTDFDSSCPSCITNASGSPSCECSAGYFWDAITETCASCTSNCDSCLSTRYDSCTLCKSGYFLCQSVCVSICPSGYSTNSADRTCAKSSSLVFNFKPSSIQDQVDALGFTVTTGVDTSFYPSYASTDPLATQYRGYYFKGTSYMQAPPNTADSNHLNFSPQFTVTAWINPKSSGTVFCLQNNADVLSFSLEITAGALKTGIYLDAGYSLTAGNVDLKGWNFIAVQGFIGSTPAYKLSLYLNSTQSNSSDLSATFFQSINQYFTIGSKRASGAFSTYYTGFIYEIRLYNDLIDPASLISTSCSGCSHCLASSSCLPNCPISYYYTSATCSLCKASCASTSCVRYDTSCNLCSDALCSVCSDYTSLCTTCKSGASNNAGVCECSVGYAFDSVTEQCSICPAECNECSKANTVSCTVCSTGYYLLFNTCLTYCPWGYTISGSSCVVDSTNGYVFYLLFENIQDILTDSQSSVQVTSGLNSSFYPNYDATDPLANPIGYYFTGSSYMSLPPNYADGSSSLIFSSVFTVSAWIRYSSEGIIFIKQSSSAPYTPSVKIYLSGGHPTISLYLDNFGTYSSAELSCASTLVKTSWQQIAFKVTLNGATQVTCVINGNSKATQTVGNYLLKEYTSGYTITIGAQKQSAYSNFFIGFIYSLKFWTISTNPSSVDTGTCSGCSICPPSGCLINCPIHTYWDGSACQLCKSSCSSLGCVRSDTKCNMCNSQLCSICDDFTSCQSNSCISDASGTPCTCDSSFYFDSVLEACETCPSSCSTCTSSSLVGCTGCTGTTYALFDLCRNFCPSGYVISGNDCIEDDTLILELTFEGISGILYDQSPLEAAVTTGSSSTFYPSYETNDPKTARYRGYYFDGASSIMRLPPFGTYSTPIIYFAPEITFEAWVFPSSNSGTIVSKQDVTNLQKIFAVSIVSLYPTLSAYFYSLGSTTFTCTLALTIDTWNFFGFTVSYSSTESAAACFVGTSSSSSTNLGEGFIDDTISSYKYMIGASTANSGFSAYFKGFVYQIKIQNSVESANFYSSSCTGGCSVCPVNGVCLASCLINQYWVGSNHDDCAACDSGCSLGCISASVTCNLCDDIRCKICTDYAAGTCTQCITNAENTNDCECKSGFYWNAVTETCDTCHSTCATCSSYGFMLCDTCVSGHYFLNGVCFPYCPTGFSISGSSCSESQSPFFSVALDKIQGVIYDTISSIPLVTGPTSTFYPSMETLDPYPLKSRGYYFAGNSIMKLPPTAEFTSPIIKLGNSFTISTWAFLLTDGTLLAVQSSTYSNSLKITLTAQPVLYLTLQDSGSTYSYTCQTSLESYWNYLAFYIKLDSSGSTKASCTVNTVTDTLYTLATGYHLPYSSFFTLGAKLASSNTYSSYIKAYIYSIKMYNSYVALSETTNSCDTSEAFCTLCPLNTAVCLNKCAHNTFWDGSVCSPCSCNSCVRDDSVCNLCFDEICDICSDFNSGSCTKCKLNAVLSSASTCSCKQYYYWDDVSKGCLKCNSKCAVCTGSLFLDCSSCVTGNYWFFDVCLPICPSGYSENLVTLNCDLDYEKVLSLNFDTLSGQPGDTSQSVIITKAGTVASNFFPAYDTDDPYASYKRGFYFKGSSKVFMPPYTGNSLPLLTLAPDLNIAVWVRPSGSGFIISHQMNAVGVSTIFALSISSSKGALTLKLSTAGTVSKTTSTIVLDTWNHIGFIIKVTKSVGTSITPYLNSVSGTVSSYSYDYFLGQTSNILWVIGAKYLSTNSFTSFLTGYLYSIEIWNKDVASSNWAVSTSCTSNPTACSACPSSSNACLPECGINEYYDPSTPACGPCKSTCTGGCRDATYCNLCYDPICNNCFNFDSGSCTNCKANTLSGISPCTCSTQYVWYPDTETCSMCYAGCYNCISPIHNDCVLCLNGYFLTYNECIDFCPTLFTKDTANRLCTAPTDVYVFKLEMASVIYGELYDSKSDFKVITGTSSNFYPNYDASDPLAADSRGYYFTGSSFMSLQNSGTYGSLAFAPKLTIGIWVNYITDGTLLAKQHILNTASKYLEFSIVSAKPTLNLRLTTGQFSVTSTTTLVANSWYYISASIDIDSSANSICTFTINDATEPSLTFAQDYFKDLETSFTFLIGSRFLTSTTREKFFKGFIWQISLWQGQITDFSSEYSITCSGCSVCPISQTCISACAANTLTPSCAACLSCGSTLTCVSSSTCNLCSDLKCEKCKDYTATGCTQCKVNAGFSAGIGSACMCDSGYSWNSVTETCDICANLCSPCYNLQTTGCSACVPGAYFHNNVCMPFCPTGFIPGSTSCSGTSGLVFRLSLLDIKGTVTDTVNSKIQVITGTSSTFYPTYESNDPFAINERGYYFDGIGSVMSFVANSDNNLQMVLSPVHTIGLWVLPYTNQGVYVSKMTNVASPISYLIFESTILGYLQVTVKFKLITTPFVYTSTEVITLNAWNHIGFALYINTGTSNSEIISYKNGVASSISILGSGHYEDLTSNYLFTIGATYNPSKVLTTFFKGYINELKIWNKNQNLASEIGTCSTCFCPSSTNVCISTCLYTQYIDFGGACSDCLNSCPTGCVRSQDCNLCNNRLCLQCTDFSSSGCSQCKTNAVKIIPSNSCQCSSGSYYDSSTASCLSCFTYCESCESGINGDCLSCKTNNYLNPEGTLCLTTCPIGYNIVGNKCAKSSEKVPIVFQFNRLTNVMLDTNNVYGAFMGSTNAYLGAFDVNDPYPIYNRGVYFTGTAYVSLPKNSVNETSLILGNSHTISMWVRTESHTSNHYLANKEDGTNQRLSIYIDKTTLQSKAIYRVFTDSANTASVINAIGPTLAAWDEWVEVSVMLGRTGYSTEVRIYVNGVSGSVSSLPNTFFHDVESNTFELGRSKALGKYMKGFIYEIRLYNTIVPISAPGTSCGCGGCTVDGKCLLDCGYLFYFDSTCKPCLGICSTGCTNGNNCNLNLDKLCLASTGFQPTDCVSCISLATGAGNNCQCIANAAYNSNTGACECISTYTMFMNECVPCFYHLQKSDITAYFSEDYSQVLFTSLLPVKSTTSSNCKDLFELTSVSLFGIGAKCAWNNEKTVFTVTLGVNATVVESPVTFKAKSLYTNTNICGIDPAAVTIIVSFKYTMPAIIPIPWLLAPLSTYINCDDLILDGSKSSNGYNRPLLYQWIFVSTPSLASFSGYEDPSTANFKLYFDKNFLKASKVTVTMKVSNWLLQSSFIKQDILIIEGPGLHLILDGDTKWVMKSSDSKTIFVQATSSCEFSTSLTYNWGISQYSGEFAGYDSVALIKAQTIPSKIYIPPKVFKPGFYTFQVNVTDNGKAMTGSTQFSVTVDSQDLVISLPAEYFTVDSRVKFSVSAEKCYDPDLLTEEMGYNWTCVVAGQNCDNLILDPSAKVLTISSGLVTGKIYSMKLIISKSSRSSSQDFIVKAVDYSTPTVTFSINNELINSQLPITITADVQGVGEYSYLWSLETGGSITYSTPLNSLQIGIKANSLTQGSKYIFRFEVILGSEISAYKTSFTVMKQPSGGSLSISPKSGTEYSTVFKLTAPNWVDSDSPETGILTYQFGYNLDSQVYILNIRNQSSFLYTRLSYSSEPLVVWVKVLNTQGGYTTATTTVTMIKSSENLGKLALGSLSDNLNNELSDPGELPVLIGNTVLYYLSNNSISNSEKKQAFTQVLSGLDKMIQNTVNTQYQDIQNILDVMSAVTEKYKPEDYNDISQRIDSVLSLSKSSGVVIDSAQLSTYTNIIINNAEFSTDMIRDDPDTVEKVNKDIQKVLIAGASNMANGQSLSYTANEVQIYSTYYIASNITKYTSPEVPQRLGSVNLDSLTLPTTYPLLFIFILYDDLASDSESSSVPSAIDFSIVEILPASQEILKLDLDPPMELKIPIYNHKNGTVDCVFKDGNWSNFGCLLLKFENNIAHCQCNHTSLFSAGSDLLPYIPPEVIVLKPEEADKSHWLIMFNYSSGLLGVWIILSSILLIIDQNEFSKRKIAEDMANERFNKWYKTEEVVEQFQSPDKKVNETLTVDQNPTFFRKVNYEPEIVLTARKEANPFLKVHEDDGKKKQIKDNSFSQPSENQAKDQGSSDKFLTPSTNPFSKHYFFSFLIFYEPFYARFIRCLTLFTSLTFQCFLLGIIVAVLKEVLEIPDNLLVSDIFTVVNYKIALLSAGVVVLVNLLAWVLLFMMKNIVSVHNAGLSLRKTRSKFWKIFGVVFCLGIMGFSIFCCYFLANRVYTPQSIVWLLMTCFSFLTDFIVVQGFKAFVFCIRNRKNAMNAIMPEINSS